MLLHSVFAPAEIAKERDVIREEMAMYLDQPHTHVQELLNGLMWPDHPLGRPLTGTGRTLEKLGRKELLGYLRAHYVAAATAIVVAGPVEHARVCRAARPLARHFRRGPPAVFQPVSARQSAPAVKLFTKDVEQTQLALGLRACSRHDPHRYALRLLNVILGENMSSRLFQVVREDHGLAYSIHSGVTHFDDTGALVVSAGVETGTLQKSLRLIRRELQRLTEAAPSRAEFHRARDYVIGQLELSLESTENHMMWTGEQILAFDRVRPLAEVKELIARVRPPDLRAAARETFRPERTNLALVSPLKTTRQVTPSLAPLN
jgi:predicted Zn-dependent peptidase